MLSRKSKDGKDDKDRKPGKRSIEVSFFDIFSPGRTIRQAKNRSLALKATDNSNAQGAAPAGGQDAITPQAPSPAPTQAPAPTPAPATVAQTQQAPPAPAAPVVEHHATAPNQDTSTVETAPGWTADQDSRLTEMKNNNQSWKVIAAAIDNKAVSDVKKRWKEIGSRTEQAKSHNEGGKGKVEGGKAENKGKEVEVDKVDTSSTHDQYSTSSNVDQGEPRIQRIYVIDPDFNIEEIEFLQRLWAKYVNHPDRPLAVASRFFDKTGRRITTVQVRDRFEDY